MVQDHMPDNVLRALEKVRWIAFYYLSSARPSFFPSSDFYYFCFAFQLLKQDPKATRQLGDENVPRIVIQEPTSTTNETLDK